jgi:hypothetical protein
LELLAKADFRDFGSVWNVWLYTNGKGTSLRKKGGRMGCWVYLKRIWRLLLRKLLLRYNAFLKI